MDEPRHPADRPNGVAPLDHTSRNIVIAALVIVLAIVYVVVVKGDDEREVGQTPASGAASSLPPPASPRVSGLQEAPVPDDDDLAADDDELEIYSLWVRDFRDVDVDDGGAASELASLARNYGGSADDTGMIRSVVGRGRAVRVELGRARRHLRAGDRALDRERYADARRHYRQATGALKSVGTPLRRDLAALEREAGARLLPDGKVVSRLGAGQSATVLRWLDGDTVDTSIGRVRVLGIDTPELGKACGPAQEAKAAAEELAPPGSPVRLINPAAVRDEDRYGRLLRFVDTADSGVDVGLTLLLNGFGQARYDSRDGYQWHPREAVYRATGAQSAAGVACKKPVEAAAFVRAGTLARTRGTDEYRRALLLQRDVSRPARVAAKVLIRHVADVQRADERAERKKRARAAARREAQRRSVAPARPTPPRVSQPAPSNPYPGYTGPRCYAPGGKSWRPC